MLQSIINGVDIEVGHVITLVLSLGSCSVGPPARYLVLLLGELSSIVLSVLPLVTMSDG